MKWDGTACSNSKLTKIVKVLMTEGGSVGLRHSAPSYFPPVPSYLLSGSPYLTPMEKKAKKAEISPDLVLAAVRDRDSTKWL